MIKSNKGKLIFAVIVFVGFSFIYKPMPANAGTGQQETGKYQVDGGVIPDKVSTKNFDSQTLSFIDQDNSIPGIEPYMAAALPDIRITPLGDSITKGTGTCSPPDTYLNCIGYRQDLWESLENNGYPTNFVGSQGSAFQYQYTYDNDHEGHGGFTTTDIKNNVYGSGFNWLQSNPTDIILLHIGTNDFTNLPLVDPNTVVTRVGQILDKIDDYENDKGYRVLVILAKIIKRYDPPQPDRSVAIENFNNALQTMANTRISGGDYLTVVDMETALTYGGDFYDELHPNATGYSKMSGVWYPAIVDALNYPPNLTNPGDQSSIQGQNISLQMQATDPESDSLTYSATRLPTGLTINPNSGEISGKVSSSIPSGTNFQVTITADDKTGFPYTDPYNQDQVTFSWKIGEQVVLPLVIKH